MEVYAGSEALEAVLKKVKSTAGGSLEISGTKVSLMSIDEAVLSTITLPSSEPPISLTKNMVVVSNGNGKLATSTKVSTTELEYLSGVTSSIQTQIDGKQPTIDVTANRALISSSSGGLGVSSTTSAELGYVHGVKSAIQDQIDAKQDKITGAATTIVSNNLTANRVAISNANGKIAISSITTTELEYLSGVTSSIQTQIDGKQPTIDVTANRALISSSSGGLGVSSTTSAELGYVHGVTSNIQTQLNGKAAVPTELYSDSGGGTGAAIKLKTSIASYKRIVIFVKDNMNVWYSGGNEYYGLKAGDKFDVSMIEASANNSTFIRRTRYTVSSDGKTLTPSNGGFIHFNHSTRVIDTDTTTNGTNYIRIVRIEGYAW